MFSIGIFLPVMAPPFKGGFPPQVGNRLTLEATFCLLLCPPLHIIWRVIEKIMHEILVADLVDEPGYPQCLGKLAAFAGPLTRQFDVD